MSQVVPARDAELAEALGLPSWAILPTVGPGKPLALGLAPLCGEGAPGGCTAGFPWVPSCSVKSQGGEVPSVSEI